MIESSESGQPPPSDAALSALADEHRRVVLRTLHDTREGELTLDALAEEVARRAQAGEVDDGLRRRVRITLHHAHLPKLDECGLVHYDPGRRYVRAGTDALDRELLALLESYDDGSVSG